MKECDNLDISQYRDLQKQLKIWGICGHGLNVPLTSPKAVLMKEYERIRGTEGPASAERAKKPGKAKAAVELTAAEQNMLDGMAEDLADLKSALEQRPDDKSLQDMVKTAQAALTKATKQAGKPPPKPRAPRKPREKKVKPAPVSDPLVRVNDSEIEVVKNKERKAERAVVSAARRKAIKQEHEQHVSETGSHFGAIRKKMGGPEFGGLKRHPNILNFDE